MTSTSKKQQYRALCSREPSVPVFQKDWWLDAVYGSDNWDALLVEKGGNILAAMPYCITKNRFNIKQIVMPLLTQTQGIWINYPGNQKYSSRLAYEKKLIFAIVEDIERLHVGYFSQHFHHSFTNWLPFSWKGFRQTTRYTYIIDDISDPEKVFSNFDNSKRNDIKKAQRNLTVKFDLSAREFYDHHKLALSKAGHKIVYDFESFNKMHAYCSSNDCGKIIYCVDGKNNLHSGLFVIWDGNSAMNLISAIDPEFRNSGASSLMVFEIIKYLSSKTCAFDFEGSMVEGIEHSYRAFGTRQRAYFNIRKVFSPELIVYEGIETFNSGVKKMIKKYLFKR